MWTEDDLHSRQVCHHALSLCLSHVSIKTIRIPLSRNGMLYHAVMEGDKSLEDLQGDHNVLTHTTMKPLKADIRPNRGGGVDLL